MSDREVVRVRDVMKTRFDTIDGMTTVREALDTMQYVDTKALIVNKRNDDDEYGMVLIADVARLVLAKDRAPERVNVYEIMAKPVLMVRPDMEIRYCARLFENFGISHAPVAEGGKIIGMVSYYRLVLHGLPDLD